MSGIMPKKLLLSFTVGACLLSTIAMAAIPTAFLENSHIIAEEEQINVYRIPTRDMDGNIQYYDLTIELTVGNDGAISSVTQANSAPSPLEASNQFVPGTYAVDDVTCTVTASAINGGRTQAAMSCTNTSGLNFSAGWATGPVAGHPFEVDLKAAGIDQIPGASDYAWGKVGYTTSNWTWWGCMSTGEIISAQQAGNMIVLSGYDSGNRQRCGTVLVQE